MPKTLDVARNFQLDAERLRHERDKSKVVHSTGDIRAAGNQVEAAVREYLRRMLPDRYYVTHGHLIDERHQVSPQLDVIIADNYTLPSFLTTADGTEYVPVTSVYAVGEVKSTYYQSQQYILEFQDKLTRVSELERPPLKNTAYKGNVGGGTRLIDALWVSDNEHLNHMFSFLLCIDGGDFDFERVKPLLLEADPATLPGMTVLLNRGVMMFAKVNEAGEFKFFKYPDRKRLDSHDWSFAEAAPLDGGPPEGSHLALLYGALIEHLTNSRLEPTSAYRYTKQFRVFRASTLQWARREVTGR